MTVTVHLVAGHLGAGKTSVLRHILARRPPGERVGLVVNDFGLARVDSALLAGAAVEQRELQGSCVCCTAPDGFAAAVGELLDRVDRLFVEPTGLARPADLIDTLRRAPWADRLVLGPLIVVVDPAALARDDVPHDLVDQLAVAEVLVANRSDRATEADRAAFRRRVAALWPGPRQVVETTFGAVPDEVLAPSDGRARTVAHAHAHAHGDAFQARSATFPAAVVFRRDAVVAWMSDPALARAKGLFRTDEGWLEIQRAGGEVTAVPSGWRADSRVDLIAASVVPLDERLAALDGCRAPDRAAADGLEVAWPGGARTFDRDALRTLAGQGDVSTRFPGRAGTGAPLGALLAACGVPMSGTVVVTARDGYVSAPAAVAVVADGVVVHSLGEAPLPEAQGGPLRVLVPGQVACANVKGVVRLVVRP